MGTGLDGRGKGIIGLEFCDVTSDVTMASKPLPVEANGCLSIHVASGELRAIPLQLCNLRSLLLISSIIPRGLSRPRPRVRVPSSPPLRFHASQILAPTSCLVSR